jgi:hypothetical protein
VYRAFVVLVGQERPRTGSSERPDHAGPKAFRTLIVGSYTRAGRVHRVIASLRADEFWAVLDLSDAGIRLVEHLRGFDDGEAQAVHLAVDYLLCLPGGVVVRRFEPLARRWRELNGRPGAGRGARAAA